MDKRKSIQVDEGTWRRLKQLALDEGVTVGAVVAGLVDEVVLSRRVAALGTEKQPLPPVVMAPPVSPEKPGPNRLSHQRHQSAAEVAQSAATYGPPRELTTEAEEPIP